MKRWLRLVLQLLSLLLFGLILWWAGPEAWQLVLNGNPKHVLIAFLFLATATVLSATRLQLVAQSLAGRHLGSWQRFYYLSMTARAVGLVIPRSLSTFAGKPVALHSLGIPFRRSVWAVLTDNLFDFALLGVLAVPSLLFLGHWTSAVGALALALGLTLALICGLWRATREAGLLQLVKWAKGIPRLKSILPSASEEPTGLMLRRPTALQAMALTLLLNAALATCYHHISRAVGLSYPWPLFAASFSSVQLSLILAVTPGGLGIFDAGWYGVLLLGGIPRQDALAFVVAQRAYLLVFVLVCAGIGTIFPLVMEKPKSG